MIIGLFIFVAHTYNRQVNKHFPTKNKHSLWQNNPSPPMFFQTT